MQSTARRSPRQQPLHDFPQPLKRGVGRRCDSHGDAFAMPTRLLVVAKLFMRNCTLMMGRVCARFGWTARALLRAERVSPLWEDPGGRCGTRCTTCWTLLGMFKTSKMQIAMAVATVAALMARVTHRQAALFVWCVALSPAWRRRRRTSLRRRSGSRMACFHIYRKRSRRCRWPRRQHFHSNSAAATWDISVTSCAASVGRATHGATALVPTPHCRLPTASWRSITSPATYML
mmetsp:Transcript_7031/g.21174  ORF Transcript_7031/g.21174 Transcript_7031/m.21174 type:complete len:233 (+) Transcript_7031:60-758(+)